MKKILVTGEHIFSPHPQYEVTSIPIFDYHKISVDLSILKPTPQWIIFTSPRSVRFFSEILLDAQEELPLEIQIACIGNETSEVAQYEGYEVDFFPVDAGSEGFLEEFEALLANVTEKPKVVIVQAKKGRNLLQQKLSALGCMVTSLEVYEKTPRVNLKNILEEKPLKNFDLVLFTSPSSFEAVQSVSEIAKDSPIAAMGTFTSAHLTAQGYIHKILPNGDFERLEELLC
jgi:uroporphyrinogen-III synthase